MRSTRPPSGSCEHIGFVVCGTDEIGMSDADIAARRRGADGPLRLPQVADRLQQGLLNEMFLARLMIHPEGLLQRTSGRSTPTGDHAATATDAVLDTPSRAFYRGNSQGGIMGGALTALAPDFDQRVLGVTAMNYSVLLTRSAAFDLRALLQPAYPDELDRPLALGLVQMLWDRGEPNGYAHRMTDNPLPNTPPHKVLMDIAFGDHLVTNWQANVQARTIGA